MHRGATDRHGTIVRGYAWHVYPDPATPGVFEGQAPFTGDDARGLEQPANPPSAAGVLAFWQIDKNAPGIHNDVNHGNTYLVISERPEPPPVSHGWYVSPARIDESFQLDQRGKRWVRTLRVVKKLPVESGTLLECEFQIDRTP